MKCTCEETWPPEYDPECLVHGNIDVLKQVLSDHHFLAVMTGRLEAQMNSMYGKEKSMPYTPQLPAILGADNRAAGVRSEEWLRKYVAETGVVCIATWNEYPNQHVVKQYALYVDGTQKASLIGQKLEGIIALRDFLNHVIESETGTVPEDAS